MRDANGLTLCARASDKGRRARGTVRLRAVAVALAATISAALAAEALAAAEAALAPPFRVALPPPPELGRRCDGEQAPVHACMPLLWALPLKPCSARLPTPTLPKLRGKSLKARKRVCGTWPALRGERPWKGLSPFPGGGPGHLAAIWRVRGGMISERPSKRRVRRGRSSRLAREALPFECEECSPAAATACGNAAASACASLDRAPARRPSAASPSACDQQRSRRLGAGGRPRSASVARLPHRRCPVLHPDAVRWPTLSHRCSPWRGKGGLEPRLAGRPSTLRGLSSREGLSDERRLPRDDAM